MRLLFYVRIQTKKSHKICQSVEQPTTYNNCVHLFLKAGVSTVDKKRKICSPVSVSDQDFLT